MILEDKRQVGIFLLANIVAIYANGQNYNERGNLHTGIAIDDEDDKYLMNTEYYGWSEVDDISEVWRWNVEEYPHPQLDYRICNRGAPSNICDPDRILSKEQANNLDSVIRNLFNKTKCICEICDSDNGGIQIGIALLKNTFQPYIEHQSKVIRSFTENLRSKWNLGQCGNDLLIVLATDDRQSYTDVGHATAKYISENVAYSVFNSSKAYFSKGAYYDGLLQMLQSYEKISEGFAKIKDQPKIGTALLSGIIVIIVVVIGVLILITVLLYRKNNTNKVQKINQVENGAAELSPDWRHRSIKTIFSTFKSTNDKYGPCKSQDGTKLPPYTDDEEVLNLELAMPDPPKEIQTPKQPSQNSNQNQESQNKPEDLQPVHEETVRLITGQNNQHPGANVMDFASDIDDQRTSSNVENKSSTLVTFAPKSTEKGLHQTDL